jgi:NADH-quinone oxidoreductase subunit L
MVARLSPMFEFSEIALATVTVVGAVTAWLCATIGLVQNDIKRVIAYSTCSQLGYMFVACGVSAYSVGIFHLMTHAYFKALLFLGAGSVIHAMMAEQDIRIMGRLRKYMPVTYVTMLIGAVALSGIPPFAGFYSKDMIIEVAAVRNMGWVSEFAYWCVLSGVFMTAFYTFRMFFLTFHNSDRVPEKIRSHLHESPKVITVPLIILSIGAIFAGWWGAHILNMPGEDSVAALEYFGSSIFVLDAHNPILTLEDMEHAHATSFWLEYGALILALAGIAAAFLMYFRETRAPVMMARMVPWLHAFLLDKWRFDEAYWKVFIMPARCLGNMLWKKGDLGAIDGKLIHSGIVDSVLAGAARLRKMQTGMVYHYAYAMVIGVFGLLTWLVLKG